MMRSTTERLLFRLVAVLAALGAWPVSLAVAQGSWNYCDPLRAYYPYVSSCPAPWRQVPALSPGPPPPNLASPGPGAGPPPQTSGTQPNSEVAKAESELGTTAGAAAQERSEQRQTTRQLRAAEIGTRREQDAADGYHSATVSDVLLRYKSMAHAGVVITGYYARLGQIATLADKLDSGDPVWVVSDRLTRGARKTLADCVNCRITIWARKGCSNKAIGQQTGAPCLVIDRLKKGTYEADTPILR